MSKAALRALKEAVDAEEYEAALQKCDELLKECSETLEPQERFILLSTKGHVCIQLSKVDLGEKTLLEASKLVTNDIPQPQVQKLYKILGDLYEKTCKWDSYASVTTKLYDMVVEKGNLERAEILSVAIAEAYSKCKSLKTLEEGCIYINACFRDQKLMKTAKNTVNLVSSYGTILDTVQDEKAKAAARSISAKKPSTVEEEWRLPDAAVECLHMKLMSEPSFFLPEQNKGLVSILSRYLQKARKSVFNNELTWKDMLQVCQRVKAIITSSEELLVLFMECYYFGAKDALNDLMLLTDNIIASNASCPAANIVKAFHLLQNGMHLDALPYVEKCMDHWKNKPENPQSQSKRVVSNSIASKDIILSLCIIMIVLVNAYTEFHFPVVFDTLHFVEEAGRRCEHLHSRYDFFGGKMMYMIQVCKFMAYCTVKQKKYARAEFLSLLKSPHDNCEAPVRLHGNSSGGDGLLQLEVNENFDFESDFSNISCFMTLLLLRNMEEYDVCIDLGNQMCSLDAVTSIRSVFAEVEVLWCRTLQQIICRSHSQIERRSKLSPISKEILLIECNLSSDECNRELLDILAKFQALCEKKDESESNEGVKASIVTQLELVVKYRICLIMWILGGNWRSDKNAMFASLLAIAKKFPSYGLTYTLLGHYYAEISNDVARAEKCYLRALSCNSMDSEAGYTLSKLYLQPGGVAHSNTNADTLWSNVIEQSTSHSFWALNLKAHYYMQQGGEKIPDALDYFRKSVEIDEDCGQCWFGMGYCYLKLKQNSAAQKSLLKALTFIPDNDVIETMLAEVERRLGLFNECLFRFQKILSRSPDDLVAYKGVGDSCLLLAYRYIAMGWSRGAAKMITEAIENIEKALKICSNDDERKAYNTLMGDCCKFSRLLTPLDFRDNCFGGTDDTDTICDYTPIENLLQRGKIAYESLLESDTSGNIQYSIGSLLYFKAMLMMFSRGQGSGITSTSMLIDPQFRNAVEEAKEYFIKGIEIVPEHGGCWNGLGLCWLDDPFERQVCFTEAVKCGDVNAGFTNMGVTSLFHGCCEDARVYFSELRARTTAPEVWVSIGHAYEQEMTKDRYATPMKSAADAYFSAMEVSKPTEALLSTAVMCMKMRGYFDNLESDVEEIFFSPKPPQASEENESNEPASEQSVEESALSPLEKFRQNAIISLQNNEESGQINQDEESKSDEPESEESLLLKEIQESHCSTCALIEVLHTIKHRTQAYLYRRPVHPFAWNVFAWASGHLGYHEQARDAHSYGLNALKAIEKYVSSVDKGNEEYEAAKKKLELYKKTFQTGIERSDGLIAASKKDGSSAEKTTPNFNSVDIDGETTYEVMVEKIWINVKRIREKYNTCVLNGKREENSMPTLNSNYMCMGCCFAMNHSDSLSLCTVIKGAFPEKFAAAISKQVSDQIDKNDTKQETDDAVNEAASEDEEEMTDIPTDENEDEVDEELERQKDIEARRKASRYRRNVKTVEMFPGEHFLDRKFLLKQFFRYPIEGKKWMDLLKVDMMTEDH